MHTHINVHDIIPLSLKTDIKQQIDMEKTKVFHCGFYIVLLKNNPFKIRCNRESVYF